MIEALLMGGVMGVQISKTRIVNLHWENETGSKKAYYPPGFDATKTLAFIKSGTSGSSNGDHPGFNGANESYLSFYVSSATSFVQVLFVETNKTVNKFVIEKSSVSVKYYPILIDQMAGIENGSAILLSDCYEQVVSSRYVTGDFSPVPYFDGSNFYITRGGDISYTGSALNDTFVQYIEI